MPQTGWVDDCKTDDLAWHRHFGLLLRCRVPGAGAKISNSAHHNSRSRRGGRGRHYARVNAPSMTKSLGQNVIIENVAGADGSVGAGRVAQARPDGYTIV